MLFWVSSSDRVSISRTYHLVSLEIATEILNVDVTTWYRYVSVPSLDAGDGASLALSESSLVAGGPRMSSIMKLLQRSFVVSSIRPSDVNAETGVTMCGMRSPRIPMGLPLVMDWTVYSINDAHLQHTAMCIRGQIAFVTGSSTEA